MPADWGALSVSMPVGTCDPVFSDVNNTMRIAREEIFGPVAIIPFDDEEARSR